MKRLVMGALISDQRRALKHLGGRLKRRGAPLVHYFHQVDDPYSHLAAQKLFDLFQRYTVKFEYHLAGPPTSEEQGDSNRFTTWALNDARSIAPFYDTNLPTQIDQPSTDQVAAAERYLAGYLATSEFPERAVEVGQKLWSGNVDVDGPSTNAMREGTQLRHKLGHWLGATFFFEGEWYWGVDRLVHLENRMKDMGLSRDTSGICVPRPEPETVDGAAGDIRLEYFPSLRSPYTAISYDRTMAMVRRTGVQLDLRPVMPMMMRGIPAPQSKQIYIMTDTKREADYYGQAFGPIIDPFGEPVKRAFSLLPYMIEQNKAEDYCGEYLRSAWTKGVDITEEPGLRQVVEAVGCNWSAAKASMDNPDWTQLLEDNVADMLSLGLWGVPSFRVTGGDQPAFSCWGQDRLWLVETDIARRTK
ncbi:MAG: DsbA family protein [Pseudomonadales bacterium]|nr:DsbA family protein [Pseudomonadales bacterium]MBO7004613.1 DsbA family protein [Pseudomonadales bacterium]